MIKIKPKFLLLFLFGVLAMLTASPAVLHASPAALGAQGTIDVAPASPTLTAVDPMA